VRGKDEVLGRGRHGVVRVRGARAPLGIVRSRSSRTTYYVLRTTHYVLLTTYR
jgi:hypothetical protein